MRKNIYLILVLSITALSLQARDLEKTQITKIIRSLHNVGYQRAASSIKSDGIGYNILNFCSASMSLTRNDSTHYGKGLYQLRAIFKDSLFSKFHNEFSQMITKIEQQVREIKGLRVCKGSSLDRSEFSRINRFLKQNPNFKSRFLQDKKIVFLIQKMERKLLRFLLEARLARIKGKIDYLKASPPEIIFLI